ncbi:PAS domain S-box-containing protein [Solimonas aquatica]|uniref:histidine kinase n=1 Tax=Solimonas aquatica TaxID=489703 RepID=A0A1H9FSJ3_9GAMM|nr:sensor histidine kinase [Solimonas aquatica]SEQ40912.1 PAS domain S-box-containing protein [Solimonas aquatica]
MSPALLTLFGVGIAYLAALFIVAYAAEREWIPAHWVRHPLTYTLSLGVYATTWTFYGSVGLAANQGFMFLTIYVGVTASFLLAPVLLQPLLRLVRDYQLSSLADLFAFRYVSPWTGWLVTAFMLIGILPYIALQIQAVVTSAQVLTREAPPGVLAAGFCITVTLFAVLFGARHLTPREKHEGLVMAIAFESVIKLVALLACAGFALFGVFGGFGGLSDYLLAHPQAVERMQAPLRESGSWTTLCLLAFAAGFLLPRQFHMIFSENIDPAGLRTASWAFPAFLWLLNLAIPILLWAGQELHLDVPTEYYALGLAQRESSGLLTLLTFVGGISAASAMIIVESLALAAMCLNHLILPLWVNSGAAPSQDLYRRLLWGRRALIALVIAIGYLAYISMQRSTGLVQLGLVSFVAVTQFLPAVVGMLVWPRANRVGFLAGLCAGMSIWFLILAWPLLIGTPSPLQNLPLHERDPWLFATFWSLGLNLLLFVLGSLLARPNAKEQAADQACRMDAVTILSEAPQAGGVGELRLRIEQALGGDVAQAELRRALTELKLDAGERRPRQLHFLTERLRRNLSGLIGPQLASEVLAGRQNEQSMRRHLVEEELEHSQDRLRGLAAELNRLRRFHRQVLQDLPIGVCSLGDHGEVLIWNERMAQIAGLSADQVLGSRVRELPPPWREIFSRLLDTESAHLYKQPVHLRGGLRWLNLHKEAIAGDGESAQLVLLVEDLTEQQQLEAELTHSARLASIGTLASGVAHEIGNPLTGISCIAQNLLDEDDAGERRQGLDDILEQSRRISDIVQSLLSFARPSAPARDLEPLELHSLVKEAARLVRLSRSGRNIAFDNRVPEALIIDGDRARLTQVFVNLLGNAADASPPNGRVEIEASRGAASVTISVRDWGSGIPEELLGRIFEPFVTTKLPGQGTGLGLPLVYRIVADHGGSISVDSRVGEGSTFVLRLPLAPDAALGILT